MKLSEIKAILPQLTGIDFRLEDGTIVPAHFHVTEVGQVDKKFIDCGGVIRKEQFVGFQLWNANDTEHRLKADKLLQIIKLSEEKLGLQDAEIEVEYQGTTIEKYALDFDGSQFLLKGKATACLAEDACGIAPQVANKPKPLIILANGATCTPGGDCC